MKFVCPRLTKLAAVFACAAAVPFAFAQSAPAPKPSAKTNAPPAAPQRIEFSGSTNAALPKLKTGVEELQDRFGIREGPSSAEPSLTPDYSPPLRAPSKAQLEKAWRDWDKKKNWAVPDSDADSDDPSKALLKDGGLSDEDSIGAFSRESVVHRYISGSDAKSKRGSFNHGRGGDSERNGDRGDRDRDRDRGRDNDSDSKSDRDRNDKSLKPIDADANGLAQFSLGAYLNPGAQNTSFGDMSQRGERWNQTLRSDFSSIPPSDRNRNGARDREADRSAAEFNQLLRPHGIGAASGSATGLSDPINLQADLTRREINPIVPRGLGGPSAGSSTFGLPSPGRDSFRADGMNGILGVTGPGASSLAPTMSSPISAPSMPPRPTSLVAEPPRKLF